MINAVFEALGYRKKEPQEGDPGLDPIYEYAKTRYEGYLRDRQAYLKESLEISDRFDKAILTLSGGSLVLSLTFIEKLAPNPLGWSLALLFLAWFLLILSVLFGVYALASSQIAIQSEIAHLDQTYQEFLDAYEKEESLPIATVSPVNRAKGATQRLNVWSMICLGFGVLLLCLFSLVNLCNKTNQPPSPQVLQVQLQMPAGFTLSPANTPAMPVAPPGAPLQPVKLPVPSGSNVPSP